MTPSTFDFARVRADFPILSTEVRGKPLTFLDNGATSQKPTSVIEAIDRYYRTENSNIHRGVHYLSEQATDAYESARAKTAKFIGAPDQDEIIFVRGATEGINLIAHGFVQVQRLSGAVRSVSPSVCAPAVDCEGHGGSEARSGRGSRV